MSNQSDNLIAELVADLAPVRRLRPATGLSQAAIAALFAVAIAAFGYGLRPDLLSGKPDPLLPLLAGPFLLLAGAAAYGAVQMSQPQVGNRQTGWQWAAAMAALLPVSAVLAWLASLSTNIPLAIDQTGWTCSASGIALGLAVAASLTLWLRRGAPTSPERAGLLTGLASGAAGMFAYSLHCQHNDIGHIGLWHSLAVVGSAGLGRWLVPAAVRW